MKKLIIILMVASIPAAAQSIKGKTKDKFTGMESTMTTTESLAMTMGLPQVRVFGGIFNDTKEKNIGFTLYLVFPPSLSVKSLKSNESEVVLLPEAGDPITLKYSGEYKVYLSNEHMYFYSNLTEDDLREFIGRKFTDIRTPGHDYKIKGKQQLLLSNMAKLLVDNKPSTIASSDSTSATIPSLADELAKLKSLFDSGALTQAEYDAAKKKLLGQ